MFFSHLKIGPKILRIYPAIHPQSPFQPLFHSHPQRGHTDHTLASTASTSLRAVCLSAVPQFLQQGIKSVVEVSQHGNNLAISSTQLNEGKKTMLNYAPLLPYFYPSILIYLFIIYSSPWWLNGKNTPANVGD